MCAPMHYYINTHTHTHAEQILFKSVKECVDEEDLNIYPHAHFYKIALPFSFSSPFGNVKEFIIRIY